jgi:hypothetical protein
MDAGAIPVRVAIQNIPDPANFQTPPPATLAGGASWVSGPISLSGYRSLAVNAKLSQAGTLTIQRYMDLLGLIAIGAPVTQAMTANVDAYVALNDGLPAVTYSITVHNTSGSTGNLTNVAVLEQA